LQVNPSDNPHYDWNDEEGGGWGDDDWGVEPDDQFQDNLAAGQDPVEGKRMLSTFQEK
jgi:hypothetical protein